MSGCELPAGSLGIPGSPRAAGRWWSLWALSAAVFAFAGGMGISLTWDGSFYLFATLQDGAPMIPHGRTGNYPLLGPVSALAQTFDDPMLLAVVHGLLCAAVPVLSLAAAFAMLRGGRRALRVWALFGVLIAPLPGQMCITMEATPVLQLLWVPVAWLLAGRPRRWLPVVVVALIWMFYLHPAAALLFGAASAGAALAAVLGDGGERVRNAMVAVALLGLAAAKAMVTVRDATDYERGQVSLSAVWDQLFTAAIMTHLPLVVFLSGVLAVSMARRLPAKALWAVAIIAVLAAAGLCIPPRWSGALNYRKFGPLLEAPLVLLAVLHAAALRGRRVRLLKVRRDFGEADAAAMAKLGVACFAVALAGSSLAWRLMLGDFERRLEAAEGAIIDNGETGFDRSHPLYHWSAASTALILQGREPEKLHLGIDGAIIDDGRAFELFPNGCRARLEDGWFRLRKFRRAIDPDARPPSGAGAGAPLRPGE